MRISNGCSISYYIDTRLTLMFCTFKCFPTLSIYKINVSCTGSVFLRYPLFAVNNINKNNDIIENLFIKISNKMFYTSKTNY